MTCKDKFERNWAERFAIELTLSDVDYQRIKDGSKAGDILANKK